jgi:hypothetical protein
VAAVQDRGVHPPVAVQLEGDVTQAGKADVAVVLACRVHQQLRPGLLRVRSCGDVDLVPAVWARSRLMTVPIWSTSLFDAAG